MLIVFTILCILGYVYLNFIPVDKKSLDFVFCFCRIFYVRHKSVGGIRAVGVGDFSICQGRHHNGGTMGQAWQTNHYTDIFLLDNKFAECKIRMT